MSGRHGLKLLRHSSGQASPSQRLYLPSADQPANNLFHHGIGARGDLLWGLVLNWMGDVHGFKVRTPQCSGLDPCRAREFVGGHGDCRDSQILQPDRIVQTARGAGPSIGQAFYYGVGSA